MLSAVTLLHALLRRAGLRPRLRAAAGTSLGHSVRVAIMSCVGIARNMYHCVLSPAATREVLAERRRWRVTYILSAGYGRLPLPPAPIELFPPTVPGFRVNAKAHSGGS